MASGFKTISAFFCLSFLISGPSEPANNNEQLHAVLMQAREALIELASKDSSTENTQITGMVEELKDDFLLLDDRQSVLYLQQHLKKVYADHIRYALAPARSPHDFAKRLTELRTEKDSYRRDEAILEIMNQQIKLGYLEDALDSARQISGPDGILAATQIAAAARLNGNAAVAQAAVGFGLEDARRPQSWGFLLSASASQTLLWLASEFHQVDYDDAAERSLQCAIEELSDTATDYEWHEIATTALKLQNFSIADEANAHISDAKIKLEISESIAAAQENNLSPEDAIKKAVHLNDLGARIRSLCSIANQQARDGDLYGTANTLQMALQQIPDGAQFASLYRNEIAGEQIHIGDRRGAEETIRMALAKTPLEANFGGDRFNGITSLANSLAALGFFDEAFAALDGIDSPIHLGWAYEHIAFQMVLAGKTQIALTFAVGLRDPQERSNIYLGIAAAMIQQPKNRFSSTLN